jgi:lysyl-tRNA synthetase class 1
MRQRKTKGGALTNDEEREIAERAQYAMRWIENYAPDKFVFKIQDELPKAAEALTACTTRGAAALFQALEKEYPTTGEAMHTLIRSIPVQPGITVAPKDFFVALYTIFLDKDSGPQVGWFLAALPAAYVLKRLKEASA